MANKSIILRNNTDNIYPRTRNDRQKITLGTQELSGLFDIAINYTVPSWASVALLESWNFADRAADMVITGIVNVPNEHTYHIYGHMNVPRTFYAMSFTVIFI